MRNLDKLNTIEVDNIKDIIDILNDSYLTYISWYKEDSLASLNPYESFCIACEEIKVLYNKSDLYIPLAKIMEQSFTTNEEYPYVKLKGVLEENKQKIFNKK